MNSYIRIILIAFPAYIISCGTASEKTVADNTTKEIKVEPKIDYKVLLNDGIELYKNRVFDKASEQLHAVISGKADKNQMIDAHKFLAFINAIQKNGNEAKKHFLNAFSLDKNFELDKSEAGNPVWTPSYDEAKKEFALTLLTGTEFYNLGKQCYSERKYDESLTYFESALTRKDLSNENRIQAYKLTAFIHAVKKQSEKAKQYFRKAFEINKQFELDKSEYGNPVWTPLYDEVKKEFQK